MREDYKIVGLEKEVKDYVGDSDKIGVAVIYINQMDYPLTNSPDSYTVIGIALSTSNDTGIFIKCSNINEMTDFLNKTIFQNANVLKVFNDIITASKLLKYNFDIICDTNVFDISIAFQLLPKESSIYYYQKEESSLKKQVEIIFSESLPKMNDASEMAGYADYVIKIFTILEKLKNKEGFKNHYKLCADIESKSALFVSLMEVNGISIDLDALQKEIIKQENKLSDVRSEVHKITGMDADKIFDKKYFIEYIKEILNDDSITDLSTNSIFLYVEAIKSTNQEASIVLQLYLSQSEIEKTLKLLNRYKNLGNKVYGTFNPLSSSTGRISIKNPNLQAIPKSFNGLNVRKFFVPREGYIFIDIDFSQIELVIASYLSKSIKLSGLLNNNMDIHAVVTSMIFNIYLEEAFDKEQESYEVRRKSAKEIVFAVLYGANRNNLECKLKNSKVPEEAINDILNKIEDYFCEIKVWQENLLKSCKINSFIETESKKRIYIPEINSAYRQYQCKGIRKAMNNIVQGTASEFFKMFLIRIYEEFKDSNYVKPVLTIHDEVLLEVKTECLEEVSKTIKDLAVMPPFSDFDLPIKTKVSYGNNFAELASMNI